MAPHTPPFLSAAAVATEWQQAAAEILQKLGTPTAAHRLGILYASSAFAPYLPEIEIFMRQTTGIPHWVGTIGHGVIGTEGEFLGKPALSAMALPVPEGSFHLLSGIHEDTDPTIGNALPWLKNVDVPLILTHGDPSNQVLQGLLEDLALETGGFLVGGLSAAMGPGTQLAGQPDGQGLSGVMLSNRVVPAITSQTQGCSPIGKVHQVTDAMDNVVISLDGRPALDVFKEDIGEVLARDLRRVEGYIYAALPLQDGDRADYLVRNLVGIDTGNAALAIDSVIQPGEMLMFCRRDHDSAIQDMQRMLDDLDRRRDGHFIRGGIYVNCAGRGPNQFGPEAVELEMIRETLGDFPLTGFFANGEISRDKLYGYTGILTLFL